MDIKVKWTKFEDVVVGKHYKFNGGDWVWFGVHNGFCFSSIAVFCFNYELRQEHIEIPVMALTE